MTTFSLEKLCDLANERLAALDLHIPDGRTNPQVTPRNVRLYQTLSMLSPVGRSGHRAAYTERHVDEITVIKVRQAQGRSLQDIAAELAARREAEARLSRPPGARLSQLESLLNASALQHTVALTDDFPNLQVRQAMLESRSEQRPNFWHMPRALGGQPEPAESTEPVSGWIVDLPGGIRITGPGAPPTADALRGIEAILEADGD